MRIVTTEEFDEVIAKGTVVVDFFAEWCGPCKMIMPTLESISEEYPDVTIVKVNVDNDPDLAARYNVTSIPNIFLFKDGVVCKQVMGWQSKDNLIKFITE